MTETTVRATCPTCGEIDLPASAVTLVIHPVPTACAYFFTCTTCGHVVRKPAGRDVVALLNLASTIRRIVLPDELGEPHHGPALTEGDALNFSHALTMLDTLAGELG